MMIISPQNHDDDYYQVFSRGGDDEDRWLHPCSWYDWQTSTGGDCHWYNQKHLFIVLDIIAHFQGLYFPNVLILFTHLKYYSFVDKD